MGDSKASPRRVRGREREERSLDMRLQGKTYKEIAGELGITEAGAWKAVMRAVARLNERIMEKAGEVRRLELERLDKLLAGLWEDAQSGKLAAVDRVVKLMDRRAKYLGLDAPAKTELSTAPDLQVIITKRESKEEGAEKD